VAGYGRPTFRGGRSVERAARPSVELHIGSGRDYARDDGTPTWEALEELVGVLESGKAVAFASGMAAIAAVFDQLTTGAVSADADRSSKRLLARLESLQRRDQRLELFLQVRMLRQPGHEVIEVTAKRGRAMAVCEILKVIERACLRFGGHCCIPQHEHEGNEESNGSLHAK
jgi:hypothetical protein